MSRLWIKILTPTTINSIVVGFLFIAPVYSGYPDSSTWIVLENKNSENPVFLVKNALEEVSQDKTEPPTPPENLSQFLQIKVHTGSELVPFDLPSIIGNYRMMNRDLEFRPTFPMERGLTYRATFHQYKFRKFLKIPTDEKMSAIVSGDFTIPRENRIPSTLVSAIFPTSDAMPENLLKFYIHFSAPMNRGNVYSKIHLLNQEGKPVLYPFLEIGEELWDPFVKRLTVFFDPGRIKRELQPRLEFGLPLQAGKQFTLVIDPDWLDAQNLPLKEGFKKPFKVISSDFTSPDPAKWLVTPPRQESRDPLRVVFEEPLDHALINRLISVATHTGEGVEGSLSIHAGETLLKFLPETHWKKGSYKLIIDKDLEDLAGNSVGRPFEVDIFNQVEKQVELKFMEIPFDIR
ncbi:MAG TPA: hypothetical protein EYQ50_25305 [Verrucomicrobiales bacterium]|nr:hypothetical protein [Verrucomicrobiales bacterium]HIL71333.1 hypothetical protein [Verrucomicrobiota bacterium]